MKKNLDDVAGIRIICSFTSDIYRIADMIRDQKDIRVIAVKDYITYPKASGYKSYHMIVSIPVYLSDRTVDTKVEIQIRTVAMDFWASLEHKLQYKKNIPESQAKFLKDELYDCAQQSAALDKRMQNIRNVIAESETAEEEKQDFLPIFLRENKG